MKQKRILSIALLACLLVALFAGTVPAAAAMTPEEEAAYYSYTIGKFTGGYEGYAFEKTADFASLEELKADEAFTGDTNIWEGISVVDGRPVLSGRSKLDLQVPDKDARGISKPNQKKSYAILTHSLSAKNTKFSYSPGQTAKFDGGKLTFNYTTTGSDTKWQEATEAIQAFESNDRITFKTLQDATARASGGKLKLTVWVNNETQNTGFIEQLTDVNPRYSAANNNIKNLVTETLTDNTGTATIYAWKCYDQYEYLLRETIRRAETGMLGGNASLEEVTQDLTLVQDLQLELDKAHTGTVAWSSSNEDVINSQTGAVTRSELGNEEVTLTAVYTVTGEEGTQQKTIEYPILVPADNELRLLADHLTWDVISNAQAADNVRGDLNLEKTFSHESVPGVTAEVEWTALQGGDAVNTETGEIKRLPQGDTAVELQAVLSFNERTFSMKFDFTVPRYISPQEEVDRVLEALAWETLSREPADSVTKPLTLPPSMETVEGNTATIEWTVLSGGTALAADGTVTQGNEDVPASLRAEVSVGGVSVQREYALVILSRNEILPHFQEDFTTVGNQELSNTKYGDLTSVTPAGELQDGYYAKFVDGAGLQMQTAGGTPASDKLVLNMDLQPLAADPGAMTGLNTVTTFEMEANVAGGDKAETYLFLKAANGKNILYFSLSHLKTGVHASGKWNPGGAAPWVSDDTYKNMFQNGVGPRVVFRADYDHVARTVDVYAKLPDYQGSEGYEEFVLLAQGCSPTVSSAQGPATGFAVESRGNNFVNIAGIRCYTTSHALKKTTGALVEQMDFLNGFDAAYVTGDLAFPQEIDQYGASISWKTEPAGLFDGTGALVGELAPYEKREVAVTPVITFENPAYQCGAPVFAASVVTVYGLDRENLALNKKPDVRSAQTAEGSKAGYLTDGILDSLFVTTGSETSMDVILDLQEDSKWNTLKLTEGAAKNIAQCTVSISSDRRNWTEVYNGAPQDALILAVQEARYVKFSITQKTNVAAPVAVAEIELFFAPDDAYKAAADMAALEGPKGPVSGNFTLPAKGSVYGTPITWTSSKTDVLQIADTPSGDVYQVTYTAPQSGTVVTLRATGGSITNTYPVDVQGRGYGGGGTGGGSSGGGGGNKVSGGGSGTVPYIPPAGNGGGNEEQPQGHFPDVSGWAENYINKLYEKGIVGGDAQGNFNPEANVSRGEFLKMLTLTLGIAPKTGVELPFTDIPADHWARPYIAAAYELGIVSGVSETTFGMDQAVTRQDLAVLCGRALEKLGRKLPEVAEKKEFADAAEIAPYAAESIEKMQRYGIIGGAPDGGFHPADTATRAESAKILCGLLAE